ncbi:hypothetical protein E2C01_017339 [Portunus trituberculatus]|uniref:Uncharacterized protein n=1 Tax=Portunus trituberculatus TaxID=210409 RepID=A0A5B7DT70_PORTR|nr:hypothetical protein [Portunus trituberculatus]
MTSVNVPYTGKRHTRPRRPCPRLRYSTALQEWCKIAPQARPESRLDTQLTPSHQLDSQRILAGLAVMYAVGNSAVVEPAMLASSLSMQQQQSVLGVGSEMCEGESHLEADSSVSIGEVKFVKTFESKTGLQHHTMTHSDGRNDESLDYKKIFGETSHFTEHAHPYKSASGFCHRVVIFAATALPGCQQYNVARRSTVVLFQNTHDSRIATINSVNETSARLTLLLCLCGLHFEFPHSDFFLGVMAVSQRRTCTVHILRGLTFRGARMVALHCQAISQ